MDQIVVEVLAQLRQRVDSPNASTPPARPQHANPPATNGQHHSNEIELHEAVITEDILKEKITPGAVVRISPKAILTPSARDFLRIHRISLNQKPQKNTATSNSSSREGTLIAAHLPSVVQSFLAEVKRNFSTAWQVEMESGLTQVVKRVRSAICRGESPQVLVFAKEPHRVACLVNRNSQCRAAVVHRGADVQAVRRELAANVICVDLRQPSYMGLREIFRITRATQSQVQNPPEGEPHP